MLTEGRTLGILRPIGGGDPIPLMKLEITVGRRPTNDVQLQFDNVSSKHCVLRYINGMWHARDVGSTNGTTVNGQKFMGEHTILPDDQLGVSSHYFKIDYEPDAPDSVINSDRLLQYDDDLVEKGNRRSLLDLAGINRSERSGGKSSEMHAAPIAPTKSRKRVETDLNDDEPPTQIVRSGKEADSEPKLSDDEFLEFFNEAR